MQDLYLEYYYTVVQDLSTSTTTGCCYSLELPSRFCTAHMWNVSIA